MDYFLGGSLADFVQYRRTLSLDELIVVAREIADAMQAAHQKGILHRDLKPANVLVLKQGPNWQVRIIDFGLAMRTQVVQATASPPVREPTFWSKCAVGTAKYAPPEQMGELPGVETGPYSDVYAFGKLCLFSLFKETDSSDRLWNDLPVPRPKKLRQLVQQCVERDWKRRPQSFEPILKTLKRMKIGRGAKPEAHERTAREAEQRPVRDEKDRKTPEEAERLRQQAKQVRVGAESKGRQDEHDRQEAQQRRQQEEAEQKRRQGERIQQESEAKLVEFLSDAYGRTQGRPGVEDNNGAVRLCKQLDITKERANQIAKVVREQWRKTHRRPGEITENTVGMKFAWVPLGSFIMGSPAQEAGRSDDETQHSVTLSGGYYLSVQPITQGEWMSLMTGNRSHFQGHSLPVENVSWDDAVAFCRQLAQRDGQSYRLPTEAEWENACRAGTRGPFYFGSTITPDQANYDGGRPYGKGPVGLCRGKTTPVCGFAPNGASASTSRTLGCAYADKCQYVPNRPISPGSPGWAVDNPLPGSAVDWTAPCAAG